MNALMTPLIAQTAPGIAFSIPSIDWSLILPILVVSLTGVVALILEMIWPKKSNNAIVWATLIGLGYAGLVLVGQIGAESRETLAGMMYRDGFSVLMQLLVVLSAFLCILFSEGYLREKRIAFGEFYPMVVWSAAGAMLMASSQNLLILFLGLEILSISLYVMAGMSRQEQKSEESALKYFLLGAFASGFFLYGIAFFYGATGSLRLDDVALAWSRQAPGTPQLLVFGLGLMLVGLCFKSAFVPFHQWTPDVYQGAPTNVTAFMAAGSKIGAIAALWRVLDATTPMIDVWLPALFWVAILTMTVANLAALVQTDVKRILGYSSIAHAGYLLVGVLAYFRQPEGTANLFTIVYYLFSYLLMTIGAFAVVSMVAKNGKESTQLKDLNGLWQKSPLAAGALVVFVASLIGVPPTAGFLGKLMIFNDALGAGLIGLAIVLGVNSALSIYYYLGIAKAAFVDAEETPRPTAAMHTGLKAACVLCLGGVLAAAIFYGSLSSLVLR